ncbi:cytochrome-c peroxidase [Marivirga sp. S37H4]|uniref:Cytochrome-c peroxidase n=1 Tax=Marivirga aurantiaca TaxID=2802615 RepID=A0A935C5P8_9BACT|nr:cytochrome c peroxidase [Marivirga aurantiaca]MBK6263935.1 cytochrome-c peroxidase [Marivirga aurantiaca]
MRTQFIIYFLLLIAVTSCKEPVELPPKEEPFELKAPVYFGEFNNRIPEDNPPTEKGFQLGRMLFYETKLSGDNSMSCGSCHQQQKAFADGLAVSKGIDGVAGQVSAMSLVNMLWSEKFTWNGRMPSLETQSLEPITNPIEMHESLENAIIKLEEDGYSDLFQDVFGSPEITEEKIGKALSQFQRALISADSKYDQKLRGEYQPTQQELRGEKLFFTHPIPGQLRGGNCGDCHLGPLTSGAIDGLQGFHNNGLDNDENMDEGLMAVTGDPKDRGRFKTPSLRNIALTAPYMHDGRFQTLEEVLEHYDQGIHQSNTLDILIIEGSNENQAAGERPQLFLSEQEKEDIIAFLHMLTDENFINNPQFSNPFENENN